MLLGRRSIRLFRFTPWRASCHMSEIVINPCILLVERLLAKKWRYGGMVLTRGGCDCVTRSANECYNANFLFCSFSARLAVYRRNACDNMTCRSLVDGPNSPLSSNCILALANRLSRAPKSFFLFSSCCYSPCSLTLRDVLAALLGGTFFFWKNNVTIRSRPIFFAFTCLFSLKTTPPTDEGSQISKICNLVSKAMRPPTALVLDSVIVKILCPFTFYFKCE